MELPVPGKRPTNMLLILTDPKMNLAFACLTKGGEFPDDNETSSHHQQTASPDIGIIHPAEHFKTAVFIHPAHIRCFNK